MSMDYIIKFYRVPAYRGRVVVFQNGTEGGVRMVITGSDGQYLLMRPVDEPKAKSKRFHPTWNINYHPEGPEA